MFLIIDNYDSFVYNLAACFEESGHRVLTCRNDAITTDKINKINNLEGIIISPGPKTPEASGECLSILEQFQGKVPILGVCLGHQIIAHYYHAIVCRGTRPMHGKVNRIYNNGQGLFRNLPECFRVTRYHSLVVSEHNFPARLRIEARSDDGVIMAISHKQYPVFGVQFHPEAVLTEYGNELINNFIQIADQWNRMNHNLLEG